MKPTGLVRWADAAWRGWVTRSLVVGAVCTVVDVAILLACVKWLDTSNPVGAMIGLFFGCTLAFFANKYFAFRDRNPRLTLQLSKFAGATALGMAVHGAFVYVFTDRLGVPVVIAKLVADLMVFSVGQLLVLRYVVFPKPLP